MEETKAKGGRRAEETEGQTGKEEGNSCRAGEETRPTKEGRGGAIEERGSRKEGRRG